MRKAIALVLLLTMMTAAPAMCEWHVAWTQPLSLQPGVCSEMRFQEPRDYDRDGHFELLVLGSQFKIIDLATGQTEFALNIPPGATNQAVHIFEAPGDFGYVILINWGTSLTAIRP